MASHHRPGGTEWAEAMSPVRVQRKRTKGWRMPEGAVYVGRGTMWGNPYRIEAFRDGLRDPAARVFVPEHSKSHAFFCDSMTDDAPAVYQAAEFAVNCYRQLSTTFDSDALRAELAGKDLACWCPPGQPCHADVLLELANPTEQKEER